MWRILLEKFQSTDHQHHVRGNIVLSVKREIYTIYESESSSSQNLWNKSFRWVGVYVGVGRGISNAEI